MHTLICQQELYIQHSVVSAPTWTLSRLQLEGDSAAMLGDQSLAGIGGHWRALAGRHASYDSSKRHIDYLCAQAGFQAVPLRRLIRAVCTFAEMHRGANLPHFRQVGLEERPSKRQQELPTSRLVDSLS